MVTPVEARGIQYDPDLDVWIGLAKVKGRWVKATFDVVRMVGYKYKLFENGNILYLTEIAPNGKKKTYPVSWDILSCDTYPNNIACVIDITKLHNTSSVNYNTKAVKTTQNTNKTKKHTKFDIKTLVATITGFLLTLIAFHRKGKG